MLASDTQDTNGTIPTETTDTPAEPPAPSDVKSKDEHEEAMPKSPGADSKSKTVPAKAHASKPVSGRVTTIVRKVRSQCSDITRLSAYNPHVGTHFRNVWNWNGEAYWV
jgi:hypothetical protein